MKSDCQILLNDEFSKDYYLKIKDFLYTKTTETLGNKRSPSLQNIFLEIYSDLNVITNYGKIIDWSTKNI